MTKEEKIDIVTNWCAFCEDEGNIPTDELHVLWEYLDILSAPKNKTEEYICKARNFSKEEIERSRRENNKLEECYQQGMWRAFSIILRDCYGDN